MKASKAALKIALVATVCLTLADSAKATIGYQNPTGTYGNATGDGQYNVGMNFTVGGAGITVTSLGAFDNGQDGFSAPITVAIYRVSDQSMMTSVNFGAGNSGTLIGGSRFLGIADTVLGAGTYRIVAGGYGGLDSLRERLFTEEIANSITIPTSTGGGLIAYPSSGGNYYSAFTGVIGFPTTASLSFTVPGYAAGTFDFTFAVVPEASQFAVAGVGLLGLVYIGRCAWQRRKVVA